MKVTLKLRLEDREPAMGPDSGAESFKAEGTANANALEWRKA